jgi:hypothetical protein
MGQIDRPVARESLIPYGRQIDEISSVQDLERTRPSDGDSLASARGVVNGVMLGGVLWAVILWAIV